MCISSTLACVAVPALVGTGSVVEGYVEVYSVGDPGEDDRDWNSGEEVDMGRLNGIDIDMRR